MGKITYKTEKWETKEGFITTTSIEEGKRESLKETIRRGNLKASKKTMQKLFSENELKEMGYDYTEEQEDKAEE